MGQSNPVTSPSCQCAGALPKELSTWFCSQNLWFSSGIAYWSDCQMTGRGLNLDSNLNSTTWLQVVKVLFALKAQNQLYGVWILFETQKLRSAVSQYQPSSSRLVKTSDCLLDSGIAFWKSGAIPRWPSGAWTWTQTWNLPPDQLFINPGFICSEIPEKTVWSWNTF